jgi:carboxymethylenebutenolidase
MRRSLAISLSFALLVACTPPTGNTPGDDTATGALQESSAGTASGAMLRETDTEEVVYATIDGTEIEGYLAKPEGNGPFPALVLIHEWWGLNDNIRDLAEQYAEQGYVALAVDMYEGESTTEQAKAQELSGKVQANMERANENLKQATAYLRTLEEVKDDAIASVGWCFGGGWSYQMAKNDYGLDASVMYYGRFSPHDDHSHMKTDIIGHFGEEDMSIKVDDVNTFQATLKTTAGDHEIYIYPNAGHGFANEDNEQAYNAEAAQLAWQRTLAFLQEHVE